METTEKRLFDFIEIPLPYKRPKGRKINKITKGKIAGISDPHEPFSNETVYSAVLANEGDCELLVINGDFIDLYSKSKFRKTTYITLATELRAMFKRMEYLANNFNKVLIIKGNHDDRLTKHIQDKINGELDLLVFVETDIFRLMASKFDNIIIGGKKLSEDIEITHLHQVGDIVFTHVEVSRVQPSSILDYVSRKLFLWKDILDIDKYKIIAQGHNHIEGKWSYGGEKFFLMPTAAKITSSAFKYVYTPTMKGLPPINGYSVFYQENGLTDYNNSKNIIIKT